MADGARERRATDALDDQVVLARELGDDRVGAERVERRRLRRVADERGDVCLAERGELDREAADPAVGSRDQDAPSERQAADLQGQQRREPRDGESGRLREGDGVGQGASASVGTAARCAQAPGFTRPTTRVPAGGPEPSAAGCSTTPATSQPVTAPGSIVASRLDSPRLSEKALTVTSASGGSGAGSGTSVSATCGGSAAAVSASMVGP